MRGTKTWGYGGQLREGRIREKDSRGGMTRRKKEEKKEKGDCLLLLQMPIIL